MTSAQITPDHRVTAAVGPGYGPDATDGRRDCEDRFRRCDARRAGRRRRATGRARARLARHEAFVVEAGTCARRRRVPGDHVRPTWLRASDKPSAVDAY